ncbi:hypothetical protein LCGC14_1924530 [marine sediment metagenome]|uniref:Uncharacterized protein n=1 Tax=marine sediment metagenome TaxID=412755 RepID=A0A0F9IMK8_9ZZZZ
MPDTLVRRFLQKLVLTEGSATEVVIHKPVRIHEFVLDNILDYSTSLPTGTYAGKRWKRRVADGWMLGEYIDDGADDGTLLIRWTPIEVIPRGAKDV